MGINKIVVVVESNSENDAAGWEEEVKYRVVTINININVLSS